MRRNYGWIITLIVACFCCLMASCQHATQEEREEVEHLIHRSFDLRYTHPDSMAHYAQMALVKTDDYPSGKAEALNNLAFSALMKQHFQQAEQYYAQSLESSNNQLEHLISNVGMMRVCQRTASNKRFYDYYNTASRSIAHLQEEIDVLDEHDRGRLALAISDFHLAASTYFYYMQQDGKARNELMQLDLPAIAQSDSIQWVYGTYVKAVSGLYQTDNPETSVTNEFDHLLQALYFSRQKGTVYLEANILQTFSEQLADPTWQQVALELRHSELAFLNPQEVADSLLSTQLSLDALQLFQRYGDYYQIAGAKRSLASLLFQRGLYAESLTCLEEALEEVNTYLKDCNPQRYEDFILRPYDSQDTLSVEIRMLDEFPMYLIPQWLANIRESLSLAYSALGDKVASDYNRNIYLDILERTRQDKEWESRYEELQNEADATTFLLVFVIVLAGIGLLGFFYLNKLWRKRNAQAISRLEQVASLCRIIVSKQGILTEEEQQQLEILVRKDPHLERLIQPYRSWSEEYTNTLSTLEEEHEQLEKERYIHEQHVSDYKRQNLAKRTCMSIVNGITPFLDRMLNEVARLSSQEQAEVKAQRYTYISELVECINEYNDILALWIKMKQGQLSLHVENFQLNELFETISKGHRSFEQKNLQLNVEPTTACIKADKALTLFMINTLSENARKYTPAGGIITVSAQETDTYVEIAVEDTGIGLSPEDRKRILEEKVYDSSTIGVHTAENQEELKKNKGFGFGLMNCKGIIDKYRKTNSLFQVCLFGVDSTLGKGSRFFFRLPKGIIRYSLLLGMLLTGLNGIAAERTSVSMQQVERLADSIYYSNVDGRFQQALVYADSAVYYINQYLQQTAPKAPVISLYRGSFAEFSWLNEGLDMDYHVILDIRNEVAVAALATGQWNLYHYNNAGYTGLYKLLSEDTSLERYCQTMQQSASTQKLIIWLIIILIGVIMVAYYLLYYRNALLYRLGLEQTLRANEKILHLGGFQEVQHILTAIYPDLCDIHPIQGLALLVNDGFTSYPVAATDRNLQTPLLESQLQQVYTNGTPVTDLDSGTWIVPLEVELEEQSHRVGALAFIQPAGGYNTQERLLNDLIVRYLAIMIYQMLFHLAHKQEDVELAEDEKRRAMHEENLLHVQNMTLDNTLSALKHETMYYPNRIRQMVEHMPIPEEQIHDMQELMHYYKEVFTLLSSCAGRQMTTLRLSRGQVLVTDLVQHINLYFRKRVRKMRVEAILHTHESSAAVLGDRHLLYYLMECLVDAALQIRNLEGAEFRFETIQENDVIRFIWFDPRGQYTQTELNDLFYPSLRTTGDGSGRLACIPYLTIRQIIRDHEELNNHRGCRVNAQVADKGMQLWFTLPTKKVCFDN